MKFASLGSGSSGNATLIFYDDGIVLLDCGFAMRETERRLARLGVAPVDLAAIVVTHEHGDHALGVAPLARKYNVPVYMTEGTWAGRNFGAIPQLRLIKNYESFVIRGMRVTPVVVPHDAREPAQYVFETPCGIKLGVLTDLGSITPHVVEAYQNCHGLLVEANHDLTMLASGPYPASLKSRVASRWGHLNNIQTADFLASCNLDNLQHIVVGHISQQNNSVERVKAALRGIMQQTRAIHFACQEQGFDWLPLNHPDPDSAFLR